MSLGGGLSVRQMMSSRFRLLLVVHGDGGLSVLCRLELEIRLRCLFLRCCEVELVRQVGIVKRPVDIRPR